MSRDLHHSRELEALEQLQREDEARPGAPVKRETSRVRIPEHGALPRSAALLERLYRGELVPRERKPQVIDTRRSCGPYLVSVDDEPMVLLDACSQIATLSEGFAHPKMLQGLHEGRFDRCLWANPDNTVGESPELDAYGAYLKSKAPAGLEHVAFACAGGAEANEKAFRIARLNGPDPARKRVLAFEGSFHGRTLIALGATSNPAKRLGVALPGYEAVFCPRDLDALAKLLEQRGDEFYAVIVEPMMAEGGDIHLTREFLLGVREQSRAHGLPLIADEVQTGFGTSGVFFWWTHLGLGDSPETAPDYLTCAKKAGLGVVLARHPDPEPGPVNVASALRGLIQAESAEDQAALEGPIRERLHALAAEHPGVVSEPRVAGTAFAFDLPTPENVAALIKQRYARGFMTYQAGKRTIRFRLASCWTARELDQLFRRVSEAVRRLEDPTAPVYEREGAKPTRARRFDVREITDDDWAEVMALEQAAYEPARADSEEFLRSVATAGVGLVARDSANDELLGFIFGAPLEYFPQVSGPDEDQRRGRGDTLYAADLTVSESARGLGVGRVLKTQQVEWARANGYTFIAGRNRVGHTPEMARLNRSLGAYTATLLANQYEGEGQAEYYRIPLRAPVPPKKHRRGHDLASGLQSPFGPRPEFMATRELVGPVASRLNLSNWATPDTIHYFEHLRTILPRGTGHLYTTSSRDELLDKTIRCLKMQREGATVAIGLEGGYLGQTTAAARSLSDPAGFGPHFGMFEWPRLPHPEQGLDATLAAFDQSIEQHGADAIIAVFVELVGERSGRLLDGAAALALQARCKTHGIPLAVVESASGGYRSGAGCWGLDALPTSFCPNFVLWYPGGQLGQIFVDSTWWVGTPLKLISTWDGDELSIIRNHEHLRAAHRLELAPAIHELDDLVSEAAAALGEGARTGGQGLYRTLGCARAEQAERVRAACAEKGVLLGRGLPDTLVFAPALDVAPADLRGPVRDALLAAAEQVRADD